MVVAVVLALVAHGVRVLARLQEHLRDDAVVDAVVIADEEPAGRLLGIVVDRLPKAGRRQIGARCMTGDDERH